jgi:large subunit ribosomal protein L10
MSKPERQAAVEALSERIKAAPNLYLTDFTGLDVLHLTEFRRRLRVAGAKYVVVKNTLARRALAANRIQGLDAHLAGPTGMVLVGADPLAAAKVLADFLRESGKPTIRAGIMDGAPVTGAQIKRLGELPSREVLLAQLAGALSGILYPVVGALEALRDQRAAAAGS